MTFSIKNLFKRNINNKVNNMKEGTVKFFNNSKGYGFISPNDSDKDIFVHVNGLIDRISDNDEVKFEIEETAKGPAAINVELI